jgi:hypothetical protein
MKAMQAMREVAIACVSLMVRVVLWSWLQLCGRE